MLSQIYALIIYLSSLAISSCGEGAGMANLPSNDVSIMLVRNAIGCPSVDLGTLCAKAKIGGKGGFAFGIKENGGTAKDGYMIADSLPYWNIYSNESPGHWTFGHDTNLPAIQPLVMRLKLDASNNYMFSLGSFGGYNHEALPPEIPDVLVSGLNGTSYDVMVRCKTGDYDWHKVSNLNAIALVELDNGGNITEYLSEAYTFTRNSPLNIPIHVSIATANAGTKRLAMGLGHKSSTDFNIQALLPVEGALTIKIDSYTQCIFIVKIQKDGYNATARSSAVRADQVNGTWDNSVKNTAVLRNAPLASLTKITYEGTNSSGGTKTATRTSVDIIKDKPTSTSDFKETAIGSNVPVACAVDAAIASFVGTVGGSIVITMIYA